jgi:heptosyltransferase-2
MGNFHDIMELVKTDCRFFRGDIPCKPHKAHGVHCADCPYYEPIKERILIIKLGAIGDVIRTTPLLRKLREVYPQSQIWWITRSPEVLPSVVDVVLDWAWARSLSRPSPVIASTPRNVLWNA